ncbi:MAG: fucose isomerase [Phycisphaerales bacterium]|nr:fucose isomerase [Phycisphaerales bacterium]
MSTSVVHGQRSKLAPVGPKTAILIASGDQRVSANVACWPAQQALEAQAREAFEAVGWRIVRGSPDRQSDREPHGFVNSQAYGREVFAGIHPEAPLVVAEAVWQYSQHVLAGLCSHRGPILLLANWSGQWPGLVGVLNLRGSLTKAGVKYSMLWGEDFRQPEFRRKLRAWCDTGTIEHDLSHVKRLDASELSAEAGTLGTKLGTELLDRPGIMGVFDEGCMGMYNAIIPDRLLHSCGVYKERLSQSGLFAAMQRVGDQEADEVRRWCENRGMRFATGSEEATMLTDRQVREQCRMYIATLRLADRWGLDLVGIQYQLGLTDTCAASDLVEGLLNCTERPPVKAVEGPNTGRVLYEGRPLTHFNEVDECAGLDGLMTDRVCTALGISPDNTLHDLRWSDRDRSGTTGEEVWVFEISGAVPPSHLDGGYSGAISERQPPMYFRQGGGGIKGVSRPGEVVWSRIYVEPDAGEVERLHMDIGLCQAIRLPEAETRRRWESTTSQWPIMHAVLRGVSRDQMMAKHQSNHIQVVYAPDRERARALLETKAGMAIALGIAVNGCGGGG